MSIYLHIFVFIGVNLGLQLFVGIVVNNFNEHKPDHSALLTVSQKRWQDLTQRISLTRPIKLPLEPRKLECLSPHTLLIHCMEQFPRSCIILILGSSKLRRFLYKILIHPRYKHVVTIIVIINSSLLWIPVGLFNVPKLFFDGALLFSCFPV